MAGIRDALRELPSDVFYDLLADEDAYLLVVDLPGVSATTLDVTVDSGTLHIDATRELTHPDDFEYVEENRPDRRELTVSLPEDADGDAVETDIDRGVLEVTIPKLDATAIDVVDEDGAT
ncbi:heat shock protein Hsp20 [Halovivax asiaticus JCM 14624]|uniref:Heat shock protein Hsp20 n=1 Tax=Halovivax asiaticus JCM 14624 TaxID=1227490 RepID=M0BDG8_9EURY|nr:Hsp20/alpha crystallin family protein [Halovivax asiaticus]ELZ08353.1 heat shock protein Hsp20 [Halovivax asiaticus JCM 14624]